MFRKTLVRLFLVTMVVTTALVVFAATRNYQETSANKEFRESNKDCELSRSRSEFMILEFIGRTIINTANY